MKQISIALLLACLLTSFLSRGTTPLITQAEILDLQLLQTYQGTPGIFSALNKTITGTGSDFLKKRLLNPIANQEQLMRRQQAIVLIGNPEIKSQLEANLRTFKAHEQGLYSFIRAQDPIAKRAIDNLYFKNRFLRGFNSCPAGLDFAQVIHAINLFAPVVEHAAIHFFISEKLHEYLGMCCSHSHHDHGHNAHTHKEHKHKHEHKNPSQGALWAYHAYNITHTLIHLINLKELIEHVREQALTIAQMQEHLIQVRHCLDAARALVNATAHLPTESFEHQALLRALVYHDQTMLSPELYELVTLLQKNTFAGQASVFSRHGNTLRAYALALQTMPELLAALEGVGELDTLLSCNNLLENASKSCPFCLVTFSNSKTPIIALKQFWNLLNKTPNPIQEPLNLGSQNPHVAIITGVNKAGKSTAAGAVAQALVCAQSLGIAPAQTCMVTPFGAIRTCFNANAKVTDGQSLFSASIDFADDVLALSQNTSGYVFIATDELFNSTEFSRGQCINEQMALSLAACPNCIALMATHFTQTTTLEQQFPHEIVNLKAEIKDLNGSGVYLLSPGIGDHENILELVKDSELIKRTGLV